MAHLQVRTLHRSDTVAVRDVLCRAPRSGCGTAEAAIGHTVIFTRRGVFVVHQGRTRWTAEPWTALFTNSGEAHRVSHPAEGGDACTVMEFPEEIVREASRTHDRAAWPDTAPAFPHASAPISAETLSGLHAVRGRIRRRAEPLEIEERACVLLDRVMRDAAADPPRARRECRSSSKQEIVEAVLGQIAEAPHRKLTLRTLAEPLSVSPFYLARLFKAETRSSIHQHLVRVRLALALDRLADTSMTLSEIAADVGFSSHSHLTSVFRRTFGFAPSSVRGRSATGQRGRKESTSATRSPMAPWLPGRRCGHPRGANVSLRQERLPRSS